MPWHCIHIQFFLGKIHWQGAMYCQNCRHLNSKILHFSKQVNTLRLRQNGGHFTDDVFKCFFLNENVWILFKITLFVPMGPFNNIPALVEIMAWCRPGNKPLYEPMMVRLPTHICITRPHWVNTYPSWLLHCRLDNHMMAPVTVQ